jgi:protein SCO1/2
MKSAICLLLLSVLLAPALAAAEDQAAQGQDPHAAHRRPAKPPAAVDARHVEVTLHDLPLVTQDGKAMRFRSDVVGDRLVAINFIYTTCTTVCPIYGGLFYELQELLGERVGRDVVLVTMTLDPTTDVPARMKREARKYAAKPGWLYLTGKKQDVDRVLRGLDAYFADFTQHPPMALIGDGRTNTWRRLNGFPQPEEMAAALDALAEARTAPQAHAHH